MLVVMPPASPPLDKIKRKRLDDELDLAMTEEVAVDGRPLRRRYEVESPSQQKKKHAQELAELREQSEVLKQTGDLGHDEKQRQFGIIYSRRKRLREKQKVLELEEECDRIRASNQQLKVDNSRLDAILSVVSAQAAQMDQNQSQGPIPVYSAPPPTVMQAQSGQRFPSLPLPQVFPPFEGHSGTGFDSSFYQQPMSYLGGTPHFAAHSMSGNETAPTAIPSLIAALTNQPQGDWYMDHNQRMAPQQMISNQSSAQHSSAASQQQMALPQSRFHPDGNTFVQSGYQAYADPQGLHSNMAAWNQGPSAALTTMLTQSHHSTLGGGMMDGHHYAAPPSTAAPYNIDGALGQQFQSYPNNNEQAHPPISSPSVGVSKHGAFQPHLQSPKEP